MSTYHSWEDFCNTINQDSGLAEIHIFSCIPIDSKCKKSRWGIPQFFSRFRLILQWYWLVFNDLNTEVRIRTCLTLIDLLATAMVNSDDQKQLNTMVNYHCINWFNHLITHNAISSSKLSGSPVVHCPSVNFTHFFNSSLDPKGQFQPNLP